MATPLRASSQPEVAEPAAVEDIPARPKPTGKVKVLMAVIALALLGIIAVAVMRPGEENAIGADGPTAPEVPPGANALFNGRDFSGWSTLGPDVWKVENGVIKATSRHPARSYLIANQRATDFELTFEYNPARQKEGDGHHGVFYRATMPPPGNVASGLAMPLEPGANNGAMLVGNNGSFANQSGFTPVPLRTDDWNQIRIRVEGTRIQQAIDGKITYEADRPELFNARLGDQIAFEVWNSNNGGERTIQIRNINLRPLTRASISPPAASVAAGRDGWENLFLSVRSSTEAFRGFKQSGFPSESWVVENGTLKSIPSGPKVDLVTKGLYGDFEFQMVYDISPGGNNGIIYRATEEGQNSYDTGAEMQLLGEGEVRGIDAENKKTGALYGVLAPTANAGRKQDGGNFVRIRVQNGRVEHFINEQLVLHYNWDSPELRQSISRSRFKHPGFMKAAEGHIVIQHYGSEIMIRQMRVRRL
jgi:hypothetical protein